MSRLNRILLMSLGAFAGSALPLLAADPFRGLPPSQKLSLVLFIAVGVLCLKIGVLAIILLYTVARPEGVRRGAALVNRSPVRCLLAGTLVLLIFIAAAIIASRLPNPVKGLAAVALLLVFVWAVVAGLAAVAHELGERLQTSLGTGAAGTTGRAVLWGSVLVLAAGFLPVLGQLVQFVVGLFSLGAAACLVLARPPKPAVATPPTPAPEPPPAQP